MTWLLNPRLFPSAMLGLSVLASLSYAWARDWPQAGYWIFAAGLTACVMTMGAK